MCPTCPTPSLRPIHQRTIVSVTRSGCQKEGGLPAVGAGANWHDHAALARRSRHPLASRTRTPDRSLEVIGVGSSGFAPTTVYYVCRGLFEARPLHYSCYNHLEWSYGKKKGLSPRRLSLSLTLWLITMLLVAFVHPSWNVQTDRCFGFGLSRSLVTLARFSIAGSDQKSIPLPFSWPCRAGRGID